MKDNSMITKKTWKEFKETKLLWFINSILHIFGWSIILQYDSDTNEICDVYPARVKYRGFSEESNTAGYEGLTQYLQNNIQNIADDLDE